MDSLVDPAPWVPLIGRLFIAFGGIEGTTHACIREWAGETIHRNVARSRLSARLALAADLAESRNASETVKQEFKASLLQARDLAKHRNRIAHNPLCLVLLQDGIDSAFLEAIASNRDEDKHFSDHLYSLRVMCRLSHKEQHIWQRIWPSIQTCSTAC